MPDPRVLLDATAIPADRAGVGRYVDGLLGALSTDGADVVVLAQADDATRLGRIAPRLEVVAAPARAAGRAARLAWEQTGLPLAARRTGAQVVHSPHYTLPLAAGVPVVVTVHDLTFFTDPTAHTRVKGPFFRTATRLAARRAARLVTPSGATRDELVRLLGVDPARVDVAHLGVDSALFAVPSAEAVAATAGLLGLSGRRWVAFLGTLEPRKNVPALLRAWATLAPTLTDPPVLVLAGGQGWDPGVAPALAALPPGVEVLRPGYLPLEHLAGYLGGAEVVAYPSTGEGFGLPVLEAMACGATVLTTRRLSLPEVGGDAVAYCDVDSPSIADGLRDLLDRPDRRRALGLAGQERAAGFTWAACADVHRRSWAAAVAR